jgi:hypothetical protein
LLHWSWWQDCLGSHISLSARGLTISMGGIAKKLQQS